MQVISLNFVASFLADHWLCVAKQSEIFVKKVTSDVYDISTQYGEHRLVEVVMCELVLKNCIFLVLFTGWDNFDPFSAVEEVAHQFFRKRNLTPVFSGESIKDSGS